MILISNDFWYKIKIDNFEPYNVLLAIATNIPVLLCSRVKKKNVIKYIFLNYNY